MGSASGTPCVCRLAAGVAQNPAATRYHYDLSHQGHGARFAIGTPELLRVGQLIAVETFRPVETLTVVAVLYFALTYPVALTMGGLERRYRAVGSRA